MPRRLAESLAYATPTQPGRNPCSFSIFPLPQQIHRAANRGIVLPERLLVAFHHEAEGLRRHDVVEVRLGHRREDPRPDLGRRPQRHVAGTGGYGSGRCPRAVAMSRTTGVKARQIVSLTKSADSDPAVNIRATSIAPGCVTRGLWMVGRTERDFRPLGLPGPLEGRKERNVAPKKRTSRPSASPGRGVGRAQ